MHVMVSCEGMEVYLNSFLTSPLDRGSGQLQTSAAWTCGENLQYPVSGRRVDPELVWTFHRRENCLSLPRIEPRFLGFRPPQKIREVMNPDYVTSTTHSPLVEFSYAEDLQLCCFTLPVKSSALRLCLLTC